MYQSSYKYSTLDITFIHIRQAVQVQNDTLPRLNLYFMNMNKLFMAILAYKGTVYWR